MNYTIAYFNHGRKHFFYIDVSDIKSLVKKKRERIWWKIETGEVQVVSAFQKLKWARQNFNSFFIKSGRQLKPFKRQYIWIDMNISSN